MSFNDLIEAHAIVYSDVRLYLTQYHGSKYTRFLFTQDIWEWMGHLVLNSSIGRLLNQIGKIVLSMTSPRANYRPSIVLTPSKAQLNSLTCVSRTRKQTLVLVLCTLSAEMTCPKPTL